MQNCYVGDIGDFIKYGLLIFLLQNYTGKKKLILGVNWYLVPDEKKNREGKYTNYLEDNNRFSKSLKRCNPTLYSQMSNIIKDKGRKISEIERRGVLPHQTIYYNVPLKLDNTLPPDREQKRKAWHSAALKQLKTSDIIFLDPDNGIATEKITRTQKKSQKYVFPHEVVDYYTRGQSVIIYNHKSREKKRIYQKRFIKLKKSINLDAKVPLVRTKRYTVRDFVFCVQPKHKKLMEIIRNFKEKSEWGEHCNILYV